MGTGDQPKVGGDNVAIPRHLLVLFHSNCLVAAHLWDLLVAAHLWDLLVAAHLWVLLVAAHLWALPVAAHLWALLVAAHLWDLLVAAHLWDLLVAAHLWDLSPPMNARYYEYLFTFGPPLCEFLLTYKVFGYFLHFPAACSIHSQYLFNYPMFFTFDRLRHRPSLHPWPGPARPWPCL